MDIRRPGRLLLIDDDANVRGMLIDALESFGYAVDAAEDGLTGVSRFAAGVHETVITDFVMPRMSGLEVAERVRLLDPTVPVILLTGSANPAIIEEARRLGLTAIHKPVNLIELKAALETVRAPITGAVDQPPARTT